ncbi:MAG: radical SAM protein [Gammaproteobacteria bacterium]|jgi:2-deoxy-scyllo-inosamine dehydrogenase (SAM-dependent)
MKKKNLFCRVEIEINTNCNRCCVYCPNAKHRQQEPKYMEMWLFKKIIDELGTLKFNGRLSYHFYNEPLLHPNIEEFVSYTEKIMPNIDQVLYTNGDFLTDMKYKLLIAAGINHFAVTDHGNKNLPNRPK